MSGHLQIDTVRDRVLVIAEVGNNHEGDVERARLLVEGAAQAGADAVKFQTFRTEHYVSRTDQARFQQLKGFELSYETFRELSELAHSRGLLFISTPFDLASADFLAEIVDAYKVASGDNTFYPLIRQLATTELPIILSTGLSDLAQVERSVGTVEAVRKEQTELAVLHCVSAYPAPQEDLNLAAIPVLAERFPYPIGFSDHSVGYEAAVCAVGVGARIVEKHFTLAEIVSDFRDHAISANEEEFAEIVKRVRSTERMLGAPHKEIQPVEAPNAPAMRRSVIAARDLQRGHHLAHDDVTWVRPGGGIPPGEEERLIGRPLRRSIAAGRQLNPDDVEGA